MTIKACGSLVLYFQVPTLPTLWKLQICNIFSGPPIVQSMENINAVEGRSLTIGCSFINGYPIETRVFWVRSGFQEIYENGTTLNITNIQRNISGTFICVAENLLSSGKKGHSNESVFINVQCKIWFLSFKIIVYC